METELASDADCAVSSTIDPYLFSFSATVRQGRTLAEVEAAMLAEIRRVMDEPVSEAELAKAIKQTRAQFAYSSESVTDQGYWLGFSEIVAEVGWFEGYMDKLAAVTVEDVQRVAQTYLKPALRNVGWYVPVGEGDTETRDTETGTRGHGDGGRRMNGAKMSKQNNLGYASVAGRRVAASSRRRVAVSPRRPFTPSPRRPPRPRRYPAPHAAKRHHRAGAGELERALGGDRRLSAGRATWTSRTSCPVWRPSPTGMLSRGTRRRTFAEINETVESVGASVGFGTDRHITSFSTKSLAEDLDLVLDVLADELRNPVFPAEHVEKVRGLRMTAIAERENDTRQMAGQAFREADVRRHPLGRDMLGDRQSVAAINRDALVAFLRDLVPAARHGRGGRGRAARRGCGGRRSPRRSATGRARGAPRPALPARGCLDAHARAPRGDARQDAV